MVSAARKFSMLNRSLLGAIALTLIFSAPATAKIYGDKPLNISTATDGGPANGPSSQPVISGDNRFSRLVAFTSSASNLVAADSNQASDIFVWTRPTGRAANKLDRIGIGTTSLVSVSNSGGQANGESSNPSIDGSMRKSPRCVAFQSRATNLVAGDDTPDWDIYVRDLRKRTTSLASAGVVGDAVTPSIAGDCSQLVFSAGSVVYRSPAKAWNALGVVRTKLKSIGPGTTPRLSLEGTTVVWHGPAGVRFLTRGKRARTIGSGALPWASDLDRVGGWGITFQSGDNVLSRRVTRKGRITTRAKITNATFGGSTAYVPNRGIILYSKRNSLYYFNANSGNSDDLAHGNSPITDMYTSARGTMMAFATAGGDKDFIDTTIPGTPIRHQSIYIKLLPVVGCGTGC
ncbi:MAG: hypothetical protein WAP35_10170 [Solirubrobacterales bacterium]